MKTFTIKLGIFILLTFSSALASAQVLTVVAELAGQKQPVANGQTFDATILPNLNAYLPGKLLLINNGANDLVFTLNSSSYITVTGTHVADFSFDESAVTGTIAPNDTQVVIMNLGSGATNGSGRTVTATIQSNDTVSSTYTGTVKYSFSGLSTAGVSKASDVGISLYPNPAVGGTVNVLSSNVQISSIVVTNSSGVSEQYSSVASFTTKMKGLLLVQLYTDKGIVYDKIVAE